MPKQSKLRVQEYVHLSGRKYLSHIGFDTIPSALAELRLRAHRARLDCNRYDRETDDIVNTATIESDNNTYVSVINGRSKKTFTIVTAKDRSPVPFGHLVKVK